MSLGKDLAAIRHELGLSLEEIQSQVKIPAYTLKTIENDSIFDEVEHNKTYIRSFIRSYARALKVPDTIIIKALDDVEAGLYVPGDLVEQTHGEATAKNTKEVIEEEEKEIILQKPQIEEAPPKETPTVENVNWADLGKRFSLQEGGSQIKIFGLIAVFILIVAALIFYFRGSIFGIFTATEPEFTEEQTAPLNTPIITPAPADSTLTNNQSEDNEVPNEQETITDAQPILEQPIPTPTRRTSVQQNLYSSQLGDTLTVVVYAAFDKLEPVRITSDFNWRTNPFWMEQGEAYNFDFADTLLVRGQYSRFLLMFNGHVIENANTAFFSEDFDSIMLTREALTTESYLIPPPADFPYEVGAPDSVVYRISY